eukprot:5685509-Amphidinium_carterae.1
MAQGLVFAVVLLINVVVSSGASSFLSHHDKLAKDWFSGPHVALAVDEGHAFAGRVEQVAIKAHPTHPNCFTQSLWALVRNQGSIPIPPQSQGLKTYFPKSFGRGGGRSSASKLGLGSSMSMSRGCESANLEPCW